MSKAIKSIAAIALPVIGSIVAPGIGTALGSALSATTTAAIGGALGGAAGGALKGGGIKGALQGAALGGLGGYAGAGGFGNAASGAVKAASGSTGSLGNSITSALSNIGGAAGGGNPLLSLANAGASIYSASSGAAAANKAAQQQIDAANQSISQVRSDLQPYRDAGTTAVNGLTQLVNDPSAQASFIQNNPFYQSLADDAKNKLFANAAAKGKVGSGGTAAALQNSLLLLGQDLLNQNITQKQNLANTGYNAANQSASATGDLIMRRGDASAAGLMGASNASTNAINNAIGGQTSLYAIDKGIRL
jgi:hypothetical protein